MAHGLVHSVTGSPTAALSELTRAAVLLESSHRAALLPDTPAALAALTAVQCGELDVAQSVLERATRVRLGGRAMAVRHRLLLGWIALLRGATAAARAALTDLADARAARRVRRRRARGGDRPPGGRPRRPHARLGPRPRGDRAPSRRPVRAAAAGRARHRRRPAPGDQLDPSAPRRGRRTARPARQPRGVGGPVALGGAAGGDRRRVARGGSPTRDGGDRGGRGQPVRRRAGRGRAALGGDAGRRGRRRSGREGRARAARRRPDVGGRQAGGPGRDPDARPQGDVGAARLRARPASRAGPTPDELPTVAEPEEADDGPLSDREREVAALVLEGLTYKQIGERLFISAKTVEHHVARMRQRLGSGSRGELFAHLRQIVGVSE